MNSYQFDRQAGILLHPSSLPGNQGIGTIGKEAISFLDFACQAGVTLWQVCPLGPTGYGDSPYQCFSAIAGNPLLIDLEYLVHLGAVKRSDLAELATLPRKQVDYGALIPIKWQVLRLAYRNFSKLEAKAEPAGRALLARFAAFCWQERSWLDDYSLFMALKDHFKNQSWATWPDDIRDRHDSAVKAYQQQLSDEIRLQRFVQWVFFSQWNQLRGAARDRAILVMGDMPIFVAYDSVDVWSRRELFQLDNNGNPTAVAGVPPDYFSLTGQLWGNPLYNWEAMAKEGFAWWINIIRRKFQMFDYLRIDHFRGFAGYWAVPFGNPSAERGQWLPAPGEALFEAITQEIGRAPIVAEDLGLITPDVTALISRFGFPGMKVLQFAFDSYEVNDHIPHNYVRNSVVYTGTHDNDTTQGWYTSAKESDRRQARDYLCLRGANKSIHWEFIRAAFATVANLAVIPLQDILGLGSEARMNRPGTLGGNWGWRYQSADLKPALAQRLRHLIELYSRL